MKKRRMFLNISLLFFIILGIYNFPIYDKIYAKDNEYQGVKIVTKDNVVPLDKNSSKNAKNVSMGDHEESEEDIQLFSLNKNSGPYWKNENGLQNFYTGEGNLMYHKGTKKVIDISEHNGTVDWEKVKASGIDGVILRVGWGWLEKDKQFDRNIKECNRLNIPYGIYLYSYAYDSNFAYHEAEGTIEMLNNYDINLSYPIYYDIEAFQSWDDNGVTREHPSNPSEYEQVILTYINRMNQNPKYKDKVHVYSYRSYLHNQLNSPKIHQYVSWAAEYGNSLNFENLYYNGEEGWQYTSDGRVDGIGNQVDISCFSNEIIKGKWKKDLFGWWYQHANGNYMKHKFEYIDNQWYYFDASGYMVTGWQNISGKDYYFYPDGHMATNETIGSYHVGINGEWVVGTWKQDGSKWWYRYEDGSYPMNKFDFIDNQWYYFDKDGYMMTGWQNISEKDYYFYPDGHMATNETIGSYHVGINGEWVVGTWKQDGSKWWYRYEDGSYPMNKFDFIDNQWCYFDNSGYMVTGWQNISGKDYYFYPDGHMAFNEKIDGYYLGPDGAWI